MAAETLTIDEAYRSMFHFLEAYWKRTQSGYFAALLGDLSTLSDGNSADPAAWHAFVLAVKKAKSGSSEDTRLHLSS